MDFTEICSLSLQCGFHRNPHISVLFVVWISFFSLMAKLSLWLEGAGGFALDAGFSLITK